MEQFFNQINIHFDITTKDLGRGVSAKSLTMKKIALAGRQVSELKADCGKRAELVEKLSELKCASMKLDCEELEKRCFPAALLDACQKLEPHTLG